MITEREVQSLFPPIKNQLALFTLLTRDQEFEKSRIISRNNDDLRSRLNKLKDKKEFLIAKGFQEGVHYLVDYKEVPGTRKYNVGTLKDRLEIEIDITSIVGDIYLIFNKYNSYSPNERISLQKSSFSLEYGKMNCYGLQDYSSRMIKPETMLTKIQEANEKAVRDFENANKHKSVIDYTIEKYSKLYPVATVTKSTDSERQGNKYHTFDIVSIKFENGNYVYLRLGFEKDREYVWKKVNVAVNKMTVEDLLNYYSK